MLTNYEPNTPAAFYAREHGPSACAMGFRVRDAAKAFELAIQKGLSLSMSKQDLANSEFRLSKGSVVLSYTLSTALKKDSPFMTSTLNFLKVSSEILLAVALTLSII